MTKRKFLIMAAAGGAATGYYAGPMGIIVGALVGLLLADISEKR